MLQVATVEQIMDNDVAVVNVKRKSACGHDCAKCSGGCGSLTVTPKTVIRVHNAMRAKQGDEVLIQSDSSQVLVTAMIVYLLPFLLFFIGYFTSGAVLGYMQESLLITIGFVGFALGIVVAIFWDRREKKKRNMQYKMIEITKRCSDI